MKSKDIISVFNSGTTESNLFIPKFFIPAILSEGSPHSIFIILIVNQ